MANESETPITGNEPTPKVVARDGTPGDLDTVKKWFERSDAAPTRIGRYKVDKELGRGALGVVYRVQDESGRTLALKLLLEKNDPVASQRFAREARALSQIDHPNVIKLHDYGENEDGRPYYVMDLLDGETLADLIERSGSVAPDRIARIAHDVIAGLGAIHEQEILHRDVKPTNLLLDSATGRAVIIDFSIARLPDVSVALTRQGYSVGTPTYMAPEQIRGDPIGPSTDLYALGVTLWYALEGRSPYEHLPNYDALADMKLDQPPPQLTRKDVPEPLSLFILKLMAREPRERFKDAHTALGALELAVPALRRPRAPVAEPPTRSTPRSSDEEPTTKKPWWQVW